MSPPERKTFVIYGSTFIAHSFQVRTRFIQTTFCDVAKATTYTCSDIVGCNIQGLAVRRLGQVDVCWNGKQCCEFVTIKQLFICLRHLALALTPTGRLHLAPIHQLQNVGKSAVQSPCTATNYSSVNCSIRVCHCGSVLCRPTTTTFVAYH